ncbi:uncharacterized protein LOC131211280 [Anopheles bellator]|uniref:uncharacterized protein LOC131211280 n=1 Tax=Anopheles bellator TaxID=139047 RepID=UPI0026482FD7|nr:uncharacterized protein LOC131211280 [Anopheles bellator]
MDEDLEFRDMVLKKLEESGSLLSIKAKLRALLYDIIENECNVNDHSRKTSNTLESDSDFQLDQKSLAYELVFDMLSSENLQHTKRILAAESGYRSGTVPRVHMARQLNLQSPADVEDNVRPLLMLMVDRLCGEMVANISSETKSSSNESSSVEMHYGARTKTEQSDGVSTQNETPDD